jgi:hypothetical protein
MDTSRAQRGQRGLRFRGRLQIVRGVRDCNVLGWYFEGGTGEVLN